MQKETLFQICSYRLVSVSLDFEQSKEVTSENCKIILELYILWPMLLAIKWVGTCKGLGYAGFDYSR